MYKRQGYDFSKIPYGSPEHVHLLVEAKKLAFADRARWYADPAFQPAPVDKLISKPYADARRKLISADKVLREVQPGTPAELQEGDTIYPVSYTHLDVYKRQRVSRAGCSTWPAARLHAPWLCAGALP